MLQRERFLSPDEFLRLIAQTKEGSDLRDFIYVAVQTGQRKANVCSMRWDEIQELAGGWTWIIPGQKTKNGKAHYIPLMPVIVERLKLRQGRVGGEWVFPNPASKTGYVLDFKNGFGAARKKAGLNDLRIHDLRRTTGSWMAASGASLPVIGKALGHQSERSTAIYARLQLDSVREQLNNSMGLLNG